MKSFKAYLAEAVTKNVTREPKFQKKGIDNPSAAATVKTKAAKEVPVKAPAFKVGDKAVVNFDIFKGSVVKIIRINIIKGKVIYWTKDVVRGWETAYKEEELLPYGKK